VRLEHLLVEATASGPRLAGLFDFEPSWVGPVDYEFALAGIIVSAGDATLLQEILPTCGSARRRRAVEAF